MTNKETHAGWPTEIITHSYEIWTPKTVEYQRKRKLRGQENNRSKILGFVFFLSLNMKLSGIYFSQAA